MVAFRWLPAGAGIEDLFVGVTDRPIATIMRSNNGRLWTHDVEIPGLTIGWRTWVEKEALKIKIEEAVEGWITFACMDQPAIDNPQQE